MRIWKDHKIDQDRFLKNFFLLISIVVILFLVAVGVYVLVYLVGYVIPILAFIIIDTIVSAIIAIEPG